MSSEEFIYLTSCMEKILAIEQIDMFQVASFPHLSKDEMGKAHKEAYRKAELDTDKGKRVIKLSDLQRALR